MSGEVDSTRQNTGDDFVRLRMLERGSPEWYGLRSRIILSYMPMVRRVAARFAGRGVPMEDLVQEAAMALVASVDRFDTERDIGFRTYALPWVVGSLKRYFRDFGWAVRPPRRLQQLRVEIRRNQTRLAQSLGRPPTPADLAAELGCSEEQIHEALQADAAYDSLSLDRPIGGDEGDSAVVDMLGDDDPDLVLTEDRETLRPALEQVPVRERRILMLRFYGNLTQREIAERMGLSQMQVSRLLSGSLDRLRGYFLADI